MTYQILRVNIIDTFDKNIEYFPVYYFCKKLFDFLETNLYIQNNILKVNLNYIKIILNKNINNFIIKNKLIVILLLINKLSFIAN